MNKVIVIEGPDGSGKTRLCEGLRARYGFVILHEGPPPTGEQPLYYYGHKLLKAFKAKKPVVFDRFHLGETVYAPLKRGYDTLNLAGVTLIERIMHAYGGQTVICLPSYKTAMNNWLAKFAANNDFLKDGELYHQSYHLFARWTGRYEHYDYEQDSLDLTLSALAESKMVDNPLPFGTIGSPRARFLIVGERPGSRGVDLPFFGLDNSSGWINDCVSKAGFKEPEIAFVNAITADGKNTNMRRVIASLVNLNTVITLGSAALRAVRDYYTSIVALRHPSFEKRFQHKHKDNYIAQLKAVRERER